MPIYEYKCENGHVFDVIQKFTDEALTECQECGAPAVRVLHSPAIHFKGTGFHNTDYGKKKTAAAGNGSSEGSSSGSKSDSDSSSDSGSSDSSSKSSDSSSKSSDSKATAAAGD
jgi:putative FmdB family regulatory protein